MTDIPPSHPRYASLVARERLVKGVRMGITSEAGLIAHGRGEAFDYLLGEGTLEEARQAQRTAAAMLLLARRPAISVNGNVAALASEQVVELQRRVTAHRSAGHAAEPRLVVEVNLFHRTEERVGLIAERLKGMGAVDVQGVSPDARVPGLDHGRALCSSRGIGSADVALIPLEDGDRAEALRAWGRQVIAIDLNPLSRTSRNAHVTIVDELTRALPGIASAASELAELPKDRLRTMVSEWDNGEVLGRVLQRMARRLEELDRTDVGEAI
jgi:4-phosphopantoate--beta-alanine ligase